MTGDPTTRVGHETSTDAGASGPGLVWRWPDALLGALYALPAAAVMATDVRKGLAFAVGVIPAAVIGLAPQRRKRPLVIVLGILAGLSICVGGALSSVAWLAVAGIFAMAVGAAELAQRRRIGQIVLVLALPLVGVGLSYDVHPAAELGLLMAAGSIYACIVSLFAPERAAPPPAPMPSAAPMLDYGIRLGLAAGIAAAVGFALHLDHVGWACAATLLVMRPSQEMVQRRSIGRLASVCSGAALAGAFAHATTRPLAYAVAVIVAVAGASATHTSRWYVTSAFTTFLALSLLVYGEPSQANARFLERLAETALGVGLAYLFGLVVPLARRRISRAEGTQSR